MQVVVEEAETGRRAERAEAEEPARVAALDVRPRNPNYSSHVAFQAAQPQARRNRFPSTRSRRPPQGSRGESSGL